MQRYNGLCELTNNTCYCIKLYFIWNMFLNLENKSKTNLFRCVALYLKIKKPKILNKNLFVLYEPHTEKKQLIKSFFLQTIQNDTSCKYK